MWLSSLQRTVTPPTVEAEWPSRSKYAAVDDLHPEVADRVGTRSIVVVHCCTCGCHRVTHQEKVHGIGGECVHRRQLRLLRGRDRCRRPAADGQILGMTLRGGQAVRESHRAPDDGTHPASQPQASRGPHLQRFRASRPTLGGSSAPSWLTTYCVGTATSSPSAGPNLTAARIDLPSPREPPHGVPPRQGDSELGLPPHPRRARHYGHCRRRPSVWANLKRHGIDPSPRRSGPTRMEFLAPQARGLMTCAFFHVDTVLLRRL